MRNMYFLLRSLIREMADMRYRLIAICLITGSGLAMYSGVYSAIDSLFNTRAILYQQTNVSDLEINFIPEDQINLPSFQGIGGVVSHESRLIMPSQLRLANGRQLASILIAIDEQQSQQINRLNIIDGSPLDPSKPNEVIIEHNLAKYHNYNIGDKLHVTIGNDQYDLKVKGIAISPEYLVAVANPNYLFPSKGSMAVIFSSLNLLEQRLGFRLVNSVIFDLSEDTDRQKLSKTLTQEADKKLAVEKVTPLEEQPGHLFLDLDLNAFAIFVPAVIYIFTLTAIIVTLFIMFQWVNAKRQQFGLFMALGYDKLRILFATFIPELILILGGIAIGFGLSFVTLYGFGYSYANAISLPSPFLALDPNLFFKGSLGVLVALSIAIFLPQINLLSLTPQDAVRGDRMRKRPEFGGIARFISGFIRGRIWLVYAVRNILRAKIVSIITILSVAMALSVSLSYFVSITSFEASILKSFSADEWDLAVDFNAPIWDDEMHVYSELKGISTIDPFIRGSIQLRSDSEHKNSTVTGVDPARTLRRINIVHGRFIHSSDSDEIVLQQKLAYDLGYNVDDEIIVAARGQTFTVKLVGIFAGTIPGESLAPINSVRRWLDLEDQNTGMFLRTNDPISRIEQQLYSFDRVTRVTQKKNLLQEISSIVQEALVIIYVASAFSIAVAVLFVFTSASFSILSRRSEYAMLRVLGFGDKTIILTIITEIFLIGFIGALLAIPSGYIISSYLNTFLSDAWFTVDTVMRAHDILIILLPACLIIPLASWPSIKSTLETPLWKTLRERRFG